MSTSISKGTTVKDVSAQAFIDAYALYLKRSGRFPLPKNIDFMKTAPHKELSPADSDWYYVRAAAIARRIYISGGVGVGSLRRTFSSRDRRGVTPAHTRKSSGGHIRSILQNLGKLGVVEVDEKTGGRRLTKEGQRDLDRVAGQIKSKA